MHMCSYAVKEKMHICSTKSESLGITRVCGQSSSVGGIRMRIRATAALALALLAGSPALGNDDNYAELFETGESLDNGASAEREPVLWFGKSGKSLYWVLDADIRLDRVNGGGELWMRGSHSEDQTVAYRTSVWKIRFDCRGYMRTIAFTTYAPDGGVMNSWDGFGQQEAIRPGTIYGEIEAALCKLR